MSSGKPKKKFLLFLGAQSFYILVTKSDHRERIKEKKKVKEEDEEENITLK